MSESKPSKLELEELWQSLPRDPDCIRVEYESLPEIGSRISAAAEEAESCRLLGAEGLLEDCWKPVRKHPVSAIRYALTAPLLQPDGGDCPKRQEWLDSAIARFRSYLSAPHVSWPALREDGRFFVRFGDQQIEITEDLVKRQRFWGVGFRGESKSLDKKLARICLEEACRRLHSDICSINRFCREWSGNSSFLDTVSFSHDRLGNRFEHLVLCMLNHMEPSVASASLYDDVHSWSDLKVIRPGALNNLRIQVKFIYQLSDQVIADRHPLADRTVVLSPATLASFLEKSFDPERYGCSWADFLNLFPRRPRTTPALGTQIYYLFENILTKARDHPLSPVHDIPYPVLLAVHLFVAHSAVRIRAGSRRH